jgi:hypothetical protein
MSEGELSAERWRSFPKEDEENERGRRRGYFGDDRG